MRADRLRGLRVAAMLAVTAILGVIAFGPAATAAQATSYVAIIGAGSTYAYPALEQWATDEERDGLDITYTPNGSASGRQNYIDDDVDYAGSDIAFLTAGDADPFGGVDISHISFAYSYIPDVAGGLSFLYNLQVAGQKITNLRLSGETLAKIFTGQITNWDNSAITHDYGKQLPSIPITVVTRSDGAGESYFLSNWMLHEYPTMWVNFCEAQGGGSLCKTTPTEYYPSHGAEFKPLDGADDVAGYVQSSVNNGAIGYAEYAYAKDDSIPVVSMLNKAGYYVQPTASNVAVALHAAVINEDASSVDFLMQNLDNVYTDPDPRAYPLSSYSYLIVPRNSRPGTNGPQSDFNASKGKTLSTYTNYILCQAQQSASALGYSPLPEPMVVGGFLQDEHIPGAVASPAASNYSTCNNPAYEDGVDVILKDAAYPNACQKDTEPLDCVIGSNGQPTTSSDTNKPGSSTNPGSSTSPGSGASPGATSNAGSGINPSTGLPYSNNPDSATNDAADQPTNLASQPAEQWLFGVLTAILLVAAVTVPTLLGNWLQRSKRSGPGSGPGGPAATTGES